MDVLLKVIVGGNQGQTIKVSGPKFFIGRAEDCHLRPNSDLVSRHHCVLLLESGTITARDFGSKNGTYVNGERIAVECELRNGDHLKLGPLEFEVAISASLAGAKRPKVGSIAEAAARTAGGATVDDADVGAWLNSPPAVNQQSSAEPTPAFTPNDTAKVELSATSTIVTKPGELLPGHATVAAVPPVAAPAPTATPAKPAKTPPANEAPPAEAPPAHESGHAAGGKKPVGKLPTPPAKTGNSSYEAAADMLRKLRRRP